MSIAIGCATPPDEEVESSSASLEPEDSAGDDGDDAPLIAEDDALAARAPATLSIGEAKTTGSLNLRKEPSLDATILDVVPKGGVVDVLSSTPTGRFYNVDFNGAVGWVSGRYLAPSSDASEPDDVDVDDDASPANSIARAKAAMGFSYYWGGGAWLEAGASSATKGSCTGSCPSCTHRGSYGADCSGLVAKAWQLGVKKLSTNSHPFGTGNFNDDVAGKWTTVKRASMKKGDALVYNSGGHGHIVLYEKGDAWGSPTVYECRGCGYGCVYDSRNFNSTYHAIRRAGF